MTDKRKAILLYAITVAGPVLLQILSILFMDYRFHTWKAFAANNRLPQQYAWIETLAAPVLMVAIIGSIGIQIGYGIKLRKMNASLTPLIIFLSIVVGFILGFINVASYVALY